MVQQARNIHKVIFDGMVYNISDMIKGGSIDSINIYYMKSHVYYIVKLLSFQYTLHELKIFYVPIFNLSRFFSSY